MEKFFKKQKKRKVTKVWFELKTNGILDMKYNHYNYEQHTDCMTIAPDNLLPPENRW